MPTFLDLASWPRRSHFELFRNYDRPHFNICANVDVARLRTYVTESETVSFFLATLFLATRVANEIEAFRLRIRGQRVLIHDTVHPASTIMRQDDTFGFGYFEFVSDFNRFHRAAREVIQAQITGADPLDPRDDRDDVIHFSAIPWIAFTSFAHARRWNHEDSTPKIVLGKYQPTGDRLLMPVSVEVHHSLMDGLHVGRFFSRFEAYVNEPESALEGSTES